MSGTLEPDLMIDRRRLARRLILWRVVALLAVLGLVAVVAGLPQRALSVGGRHIVRIPISGIITADRTLTQRIDALANDSSVAAILLDVDSPGGSVSGGEALHDALARAATKKPLVAIMEGTAASAGYMITLPAARIFATDATLTGSIGVILETGSAAGLLDKLGLSAAAIVSGPLKDQPSYFKPLSPEGRDYLQGLVNDLFGQFVSMVATARHMDEATVRKLADGRAYTGRQAVALGLVDQIGGEPAARAWLAANRQVSEDLPVRDLGTRSFLERTVGSAFGLAGIHLGLGLPAAEPLALWSPALAR